jgi:hypothetical protein
MPKEAITSSVTGSFVQEPLHRWLLFWSADGLIFQAEHFSEDEPADWQLELETDRSVTIRSRG